MNIQNIIEKAKISFKPGVKQNKNDTEKLLNHVQEQQKAFNNLSVKTIVVAEATTATKRQTVIG